MKTRFRWVALKAVAPAGIALALWTSGSPAMAGERSPHGRVSAVAGDLLVRGPDDKEWSYLGRNGVVYDDDVAWADENSLAEIEMERGAWVRLGPDTRVAIRRLPPGGELLLRRGAVYVDLSDACDDGVEVQTPAGEVYVETGSLARIELGRGDETRVLVRRGRVEAEPASGDALRARAGDMLFLRPSDPRVRTALMGRDDFDDFDDWSDDRLAYYLERQLPRGVDRYLPGVYELADHGDWVEHEGAVCWRPRRVASDWRPYSVGYWGHWRGEPIWIADEPWGYTTCHYGRWMYVSRHGWLWRPGYVWGPGWVSWAHHDDHVMWAPLDPWDRPCYRNPPRIVGGTHIDIHVWTAMPRDNFYHRDRTRIVYVERAPVIHAHHVRVVEKTVIYRDLHPGWHYRGVRHVSYHRETAQQRGLLLQERPPRTEYRIAGVRHAAPRQDDRVGSLLTPREETRARVRRQVDVPLVQTRGRSGGGSGAVAQPSGRDDRDPRGGSPSPSPLPHRERGAGVEREPDRPGTPRDPRGGNPSPSPLPHRERGAGGSGEPDRTRDDREPRGGLVRPGDPREPDRPGTERDPRGGVARPSERDPRSGTARPAPEPGRTGSDRDPRGGTLTRPGGGDDRGRGNRRGRDDEKKQKKDKEKDEKSREDDRR